MSDKQLMDLISKSEKNAHEVLKLEIAVRLRNLDIDMDDFGYNCGYISGLEHRLKKYEKSY